MRTEKVFDQYHQAGALPNYPPPQDVKEDDTVALDLLVSPDGKTKVVDYFEVSTANGVELKK